MRHTLSSTLSLALILTSGTALAVPQEHQAGMKHMRVATPPAAEPSPAKPAEAAIEKPAELPARKPLSVEEALIKPDALKPWSRYADTVNLSTPEDLEKIVRIVEADPGSVPPQALFFLARALADHRRMEDAAVYYYVGQLRLSFDITRWPPRLSPEDMKKVLANRNKTQDQASKTVGSDMPKIRNPHEGVVVLASTVGGPITEWMLKEPERGEKVMARVSAWDQSATYAYVPNYTLPEPTPFEEWAKILPDVRANFFSRMNEFISGLKKLKAQ